MKSSLDSNMETQNHFFSNWFFSIHCINTGIGSSVLLFLENQHLMQLLLQFSEKHSDTPGWILDG